MWRESLRNIFFFCFYYGLKGNVKEAECRMELIVDVHVQCTAVTNAYVDATPHFECARKGVDLNV